MQIGIDISTLANHGQDIGAGRYIYNLVKNLADIDSGHRFRLVARCTTDQHLEAVGQLTGKSNVTARLFRTNEKRLGWWDRFRFPPYEFLGFKADVLHCPDFMIAPTLNKNIVLTINDLAFIRYPQFNFDWFIKKYTRQVKANALRAKKIIAISNSTRQDIIEFFAIPSEKIEVIYPAADSVFTKLEQPDKAVCKKYHLEDQFILSVGTIEPRKNYPALIKAFNQLKKDFKQLKLVVVGRTGWKSEASFQAREDSPYSRDILFLGRVSDQDLLHLYNQAMVFVYPSIFEGFGLPVLEAMNCGLPVIAGNNSSIPEVVGDSGMLVDTDDSDALSGAVAEVLADEHLRKELVAKALARAGKFSWEDNARTTLSLYNQL
ncbi:MAG: glycosyltransferase family 1 protein [Actinomycetota bacterium]|nr:glycosyltransferase family 1 protein [Actinomycetota bacterium]